MQTRKSVVAGQFYPAQHDACVGEINEYLDQVPANESLPAEIVAGIVPHAGWTFSATLAAMVFSAVKQVHDKVNTFVIFGAAHAYYSNTPAVYHRTSWTTPMGQANIDEDLADSIIKTKLANADMDAHQNEHSIEVQIPFIQYLFPGAKILPVLAPPGKQAVDLGKAVGDIIKNTPDKKIVCIGSTDLTHYGPRYGFVPMGTGPQAFSWASEVNDKKFIDLALEMKPDQMIDSAAENYNACGAGAAAAAVAAAKQLGKDKAILLAHTNSNDIMLKKMGTSSTDTVGYTAILF